MFVFLKREFWHGEDEKLNEETDEFVYIAAS